MISPGEIYALFLDIDGTLTTDNYVIPERNIRAIDAARKLGHKVFINTGRSYGNIPACLLSQVELDGVLSGNGTMITFGDKTVFSSFFTHEQFIRIAEYFFDHKECWAVFEGKNRSYTIGGRSRRASPIETVVRSMSELIEASSDDEFQVVAFSKNTSNDFIESMSDFATFFRFDNYFDMVKKGSNKANSMAVVTDMLGIPKENTMAFGDSENDLNMLRAAGISVVVANAQPELKAVADYVTDSNHDSGVGKAIEKLLLKGEWENE